MSLAGSTAKAAARGSAVAGPGCGGAAAGWFPGITASIAFRSHCPQGMLVWPIVPVRYAE
eukprot:12895203-Alexandrium_andersonii.AAC.1